jgi:RNA polymerase sigma-70 factor (ECF subfamily)
MDLVRALKTLPPQQRAAVALFYFEDRPVQEIAHILNCSESTAKAHLFKARGKLASLLREDEGEVTDAP